MTTKWTPERIAEARDELDRSIVSDKALVERYRNLAKYLSDALDHIESQSEELEAARRVVDAIKVTTLKFPLPMLIEHALDQYHALRSQHATSGEGDSDE